MPEPSTPFVNPWRDGRPWDQYPRPEPQPDTLEDHAWRESERALRNGGGK